MGRRRLLGLLQGLLRRMLIAVMFLLALLALLRAHVERHVREAPVGLVHGIELLAVDTGQAPRPKQTFGNQEPLVALARVGGETVLKANGRAGRGHGITIIADGPIGIVTPATEILGAVTEVTVTCPLPSEKWLDVTLVDLMDLVCVIVQDLVVEYCSRRCRMHYGPRRQQRGREDTRP